MNTRRKLLIALGASVFAMPLSSGAQPASKVARVGFFHARPRAGNEFFQSFIRGMQSLGYIEGKNLAIDYLDGDIPQFSEMAQELVRRRVDVIFAPTPQAALAAKKATDTIPIVFAVVGDPVKTGLVESLGRPGGNVTGLTAFGSDLGGKRLELLKEIRPRLARVAVVWNPTVPDKVIEWNETERSARAMGLRLQSLEVRAAGDFAAAFDAARRGRAEAVIVFGEPLTFNNFGRIVSFALEARIPSIFNWREAVEAGGLISLGPSISDNYRRAAAYVDKILKGVKPGDLPIQQPITLELALNLKTAKELGIKIPNSILLRADKVIE